MLIYLVQVFALLLIRGKTIVKFVHWSVWGEKCLADLNVIRSAFWSVLAEYRGTWRFYRESLTLKQFIS